MKVLGSYGLFKHYGQQGFEFSELLIEGSAYPAQLVPPLYEEVLLNKLLNEMDGLRPDSEILFILTTNRPEALEAALASRPGRVDQAIEFPLPDAEGRAMLMRLYARGMSVPDEVLQATVQRTEGVTASFIKELMRKSAQFHLERDSTKSVALEDVDAALDELLFRGGSLNRKLLGGRMEENGIAFNP